MLRRREIAILVGFCVIVFGLSLLRGRELTVHESVLAQSARAMLADGDLIVPKKGTDPWLDGGPFAQWITVLLGSVLGGLERLSVVRLAPVLMGTLVVLLAAGIGARVCGRRVGLLGGLVTASCYEVARYAWLAEDDLFLCVLVTGAVACFVRLEITPDGATPPPRRVRFLGGRPWPVLLFFVLLGATNLAKGLLFGGVLVLVPVVGFLGLGAGRVRIRRYVWGWGWLVAAGVALSWPLLAWRRHPEVLDLWRFDVLGRASGSFDTAAEPLWYYALALPWVIAPWILFVPAGMAASVRAALESPRSGQRFIWTWALLVPLVLSLPAWKHHHYLIQGIVPWALLAAFGIERVWRRQARWRAWIRTPAFALAALGAPATALVVVLLFEEGAASAASIGTVVILLGATSLALGAAVRAGDPGRSGRALFALVAALLVAVQWPHVGKYAPDARFLRGVRESASEDDTLLVDLDTGEMRGFFLLYHLDADAVPLHNLTFLRDARITDAEVLVVTRRNRAAVLARYGTAQELSASARTPRDPGERLALFRLAFRADLERVSGAGLAVTPLQAMYRAPGPVLLPRDTEPGSNSR